MGLQAIIFPLHPELFQIKYHSQEEQLRSNVLFPSRRKTAETKVVLAQCKGTLSLNGTTHPQIGTAF